MLGSGQVRILMFDRKYKIPDHQNGHAYLTSHRVCYVDNDQPRQNSVGIDLKEVDRYEVYVWELNADQMNQS
jgi:ESCRT-II complex subunit VPS36